VVISRGELTVMWWQSECHSEVRNIWVIPGHVVVNPGCAVVPARCRPEAEQ